MNAPWHRRPPTLRRPGFRGGAPASSGGGGGGGGSAPSLSSSPVVSASPSFESGNTLSTTDGTWTGSPSSFTYQWVRGGSDIGGATLSSYTLTTDDMGPDVWCKVTAINGAGSTEAASNALAYSPLVLSPSAWLRSDMGITTVGSDVSSWADQSGVGNEFTDQGIAARRPLFVASGFNSGAGLNTPYLQFTSVGSDVLIDTSFSWGTTVGACTMAIVCEQPTSATGRYLLNYAGSLGRPMMRQQTLDRTDFVSLASTISTTNSGDTPTAGAAKLIAGWWDGATQSIYVHATARGTVAVSGAAHPDGAAMSIAGTATGTSRADLRVAEVVIVAAAISTAQIGDLAAYCAYRYGVS